MNNEPCIRGCVIPSMIEGDPGTYKAAEYGLLCASCYWRIQHALKSTADLVANIRAQVSPTSTASDGQPRGKSDPPAPLNVTALDDADTLFAKLVLWTEVIGGAMGVPQPSVAVWANFQEVQGFRGAITIREAHKLVSELTAWFLIRLESIAYLPVVSEFHDDITYGWKDALGVFPLTGRYPIEPRKIKAAEKRECPVCGKLEVVVEWPTDQNPETQVLCRHCKWIEDPAKLRKHADLLAAA